MSTLIQKSNEWINALILRSERNAVGRLALYRILYAVFYLWMIARYDFPLIASIPTAEWNPLITLSWLSAPPSAEFFIVMQFFLVFGLVMLVFGSYVRTSIVVVIISGTILAMMRYGFGKIDHYDTFLVFYTPLVMFFYNWSSNYSFDALIKKRKGIEPPAPSESSWTYAWPLLVITFLLTVLFVWAGVLKLLPDANSWFWHTDIIRKLVIDFNSGLNPNPLAPFIVDNAWVYGPLRFGAVIFEGAFFLALINRKWRTLFMATAVFFHLFNLILFNIPFVDMLIIYAIFIDWQAVYERVPVSIRTALTRFFEGIPNTGLIAISVIIALVVAGLWIDFDSPVRQLFQAVPYELVWIVAGVISVIAFTQAALALAQDGLNLLKVLRQNTSNKRLMKKAS